MSLYRCTLCSYVGENFRLITSEKPLHVAEREDPRPVVTCPNCGVLQLGTPPMDKKPGADHGKV